MLHSALLLSYWRDYTLPSHIISHNTFTYRTILCPFLISLVSYLTLPRCIVSHHTLTSTSCCLSLSLCLVSYHGLPHRITSYHNLLYHILAFPTLSYCCLTYYIVPYWTLVSNWTIASHITPDQSPCNRSVIRFIHPPWITYFKSVSYRECFFGGGTAKKK